MPMYIITDHCTGVTTRCTLLDEHSERLCELLVVLLVLVSCIICQELLVCMSPGGKKRQASSW